MAMLTGFGLGSPRIIFGTEIRMLTRLRKLLTGFALTKFDVDC